MSLRSPTIFLVLLVLLISLMVSCTAPASPEDSPEEVDSGKGEEPYIIGDETGDWGFPSPYAAYPRGPGYLRMSFIFDTLVWKDEEGLVSALAEDWEFDQEELSYTFYLREGVEWHDGETFSAEDVVFTYQYVREHPLPWAEVGMIEEVEKVDEHTVEMKLDEPYAAFLNNVAGVVPIIPQHEWEGVETPEEFTEPEALVGTGPYRLQNYQREQGRYHYEAFPDYYLGEPSQEEIHMIKVSDPQMALQRGDVDYARIEPEAVEELEESGFQVESGAHDWNLKLMMNHQESPLDEVDFRRALAHSLDLEELVERALRGHGLPGSPGLVSPDSRWHCPEISNYQYDPAQAEEKLEASGYLVEEETVLDEGGESVSLEVIARSDFAREGELVGEQLAEAGFEVEVRSLEGSVLDQRVREWDFDLAVTGHGAVGGDPDTLERFMVGEASPHLNARYQDEELQEAFKRQRQALDQDNRQEAVGDIQRLHAERVPAYPLHYPTWYFAFNERVDWFFTRDGIGTGTPLPLNKLALIE